MASLTVLPAYWVQGAAGTEVFFAHSVANGRVEVHPIGRVLVDGGDVEGRQEVQVGEAGLARAPEVRHPGRRLVGEKARNLPRWAAGTVGRGR